MTTFIEIDPCADGNFEIESPRESIVSGAKPNRVTFIGFPFTLEDGSTTRLSAHIDVLDGDVQSAIDIVRRGGGLFVPAGDNASVQYFLPWPCALVQIGPLPVESGAFISG